MISHTWLEQCPLNITAFCFTTSYDCVGADVGYRIKRPLYIDDTRRGDGGGGGLGETPPFLLLLGLPASASSERSYASAGAARFFPRDFPGSSIVRAVSESQVTRLYPGMTIEK